MRRTQRQGMDKWKQGYVDGIQDCLDDLKHLLEQDERDSGVGDLNARDRLKGLQVAVADIKKALAIQLAPDEAEGDE